MALLSLRMECERAQIHLSSAGETKVIVDSLYERFAKLKREELDHVIVAGASTHIPKVRETIQNFFCGTEVYDGIHPEHVAAYGAAVQAAVLNAEKIDCLQLNTAPLSIGVAKQFGAMLVVVPRNTQIPFRKKVVFCTGDDNQITMSIKVYLGKSSNIREHLLLGELFLCGIPPARRGEESVAVCFAMDGSGILKVSAEHKKTGSKSELTLDKVYGFQLSKNEMERMLIDVERLSSLDKEFERNVAAREVLVNQVYEMREKVRKEKLKIQVVEKEVEDTIAWLEGNDTASTCFLEQKLNDLKKKIETHFGGLSITRSACHSLPRAVSITR
ncbi:uncharacterized protein LOC131855769 [Cryptomeria japonica]|uniref:uncharacterized protein LOC131855769 n=1 Tax=Cryptomeria japonica TaxID=3369 RepID=UPI0027DA922D|nr:uncharacterized protein LOC131855769 [Cryptomeria japonica]